MIQELHKPITPPQGSQAIAMVDLLKPHCELQVPNGCKWFTLTRLWGRRSTALRMNDWELGGMWMTIHTRYVFCVI